MVFWFFQLDASSKKFETRTPTQNSALEKLKFVFSFFNMWSLFFSHFGNCFNYRIYNELFQEDILMASSVFYKYKMLILVSNLSKINNHELRDKSIWLPSCCAKSFKFFFEIIFMLVICLIVLFKNSWTMFTKVCENWIRIGQVKLGTWLSYFLLN